MEGDPKRALQLSDNITSLVNLEQKNMFHLGVLTVEQN